MSFCIDHVAIWTNDIEKLKEYYTRFFDAVAGRLYENKDTGFKSYFLSFDEGSRLEIMQKPGITGNLNDTGGLQHTGIIHIAFGVDDMKTVIFKAKELQSSGFRIVKGPRKTGDGYFEFVTLDPDNNRIEVTTIYDERDSGDNISKR
jgi:lactoylglutathione lyase